MPQRLHTNGKEGEEAQEEAQVGEEELELPRALSYRCADWLQRRATLIIFLLCAATAALVLPLLLMPPTSTASQEPEGPLFTARQLDAERLAPRGHRMVFIVEARGADILQPEPLQELLENCRALRGDPVVGPKLLTHPHPQRGTPVRGVFTIADALGPQLEALHARPSTQARASFRKGLTQLLESAGPRRLGLSVKARRDPRSGEWQAPALVIPVLADNDALGGGAAVSLGSSSTIKESFAREVQRLLRGDQRHLRVWGLAIDVNLTSQEQGRAAGPFIGLTIFIILIVVGLIHRSYWSVAVVGLCLGCLIIWLKGLTYLIGLKHDQILSTIVPIAMISFGVDFAFHSIGRYREARGENRLPRRAFVIGLGGGLAALLLATATDAAAFLANVSSGIESLVQFGVAAALATVASFLMLGLLAPLLIMKIDERDRAATTGRRALVLGAGGSILAALATMAVVILLVFVLPWAGALALAGYGLIFLLLPLCVLARGGSADPSTPRPEVRPSGEWIGTLVTALARRRRILLPAVLVLTLVSIYFAAQVQPIFDVKDFFSAETNFVVALDKFDAHVGKQGGEPAIIYIEGQLLSPAALEHQRRFITEVRTLQTPLLAKNAAGEILLSEGIPGLLQAASRQPVLLRRFSRATGAPWSVDQRPANARSAGTLLSIARQHGIPNADSGVPLSADQVRSIYWASPGGERQATRLSLRIPGSRSQENVKAVRRELEPIIQRFEGRLRQIDPTAMAVLTGQPIARQASLAAILRAFRLSLPVAILLCFSLAAIFMGSIYLALISILPVLMVVAWLHALIHLGGYGINVVTATIGAISIGQGIDFAVHFAMRYREELRGGIEREAALHHAGAGTGSALLASALSSIAGFSILAFSPMPMFSSYGLLTAIMIALAAAASLLVLPSLLMITTPSAHRRPR